MTTGTEETLVLVSQLATWCKSRNVELKIAWSNRQWRVAIRPRGRKGFQYAMGKKGDSNPASLVELLDRVIGNYNSFKCVHDVPQQPSSS